MAEPGHNNGKAPGPEAKNGEAAAQDIVAEVESGPRQQVLIVPVGIAAEALDRLTPTVGEQVGDGDDLELARRLLEPFAVDGQAATALAEDADAQRSGGTFGSARSGHGS